MSELLRIPARSCLARGQSPSSYTPSSQFVENCVRLKQFCATFADWCFTVCTVLCLTVRQQWWSFMLQRALRSSAPLHICMWCPRIDAKNIQTCRRTCRRHTIISLCTRAPSIYRYWQTTWLDHIETWFLQIMWFLRSRYSTVQNWCEPQMQRTLETIYGMKWVQPFWFSGIVWHPQQFYSFAMPLRYAGDGEGALLNLVLSLRTVSKVTCNSWLHWCGEL